MRLRSRLRAPAALRRRYPTRPARSARPMIGALATTGPAGSSVSLTRRNPCIDYLDYMLANHPARFSAPGAVEEWRLTYEAPYADTQLECLADLQDVKRADRAAAKALAATSSPGGRRGA